MSSPSTGQALVERTEIHKSCKSIETLLNILNEYCEAVGAIVALQKKLSKALKETAALRVTGDIVSNALLASANIYESLSEVDTKFSKIADKEYDVVSTEVKKWFKKLAKEERLHDERMANANAKIKQAGQSYEKKTKKKAADVNEEHSRYINLINTLGPEISQEKYNHGLNVSQRHAATTASVAGCLARLADFEWQKSCECVRRFSPTIGPLGTYKSLCEGGWARPLPADLPDIGLQTNGVSTPHNERNATLRVNEDEVRQLQTAATSTTPEPPPSPEQAKSPLLPSIQDTTREDNTRDSPTLSRQPPTNPNVQRIPQTASAPEGLEPPRPTYVEANNTGSVRSLSAFPAPPTHFPIPLPIPSRQQSYQSTNSHLEFPSSLGPLADSPVSANEDLSHSGHLSDRGGEPSSKQGRGHLDLPRASGSSRSTQSSNSGPPSPDQRFNQPPTIPEAPEPDYQQTPPTAPQSAPVERPPAYRSQTTFAQEPVYPAQSNGGRPTPPSHRSTSSADVKPLAVRGYREDYREVAGSDKEFGVMGGGTPVGSKIRSLDSYSRYPKQVERTDTGQSSGSIVAAMRSRYDTSATSASPPPRELPRTPTNVGDMAARLQHNDTGPTSPRLRGASPPVSRQQSLPLIDTARQVQESYRPTGMMSPDEGRRRLQRQEEMAETQNRQKEQELREREMELEMRVRELERDRMRLQTLREGQDLTGQETGHGRDTRETDKSGQFGVRPRERRVSLRNQLRRPLSQMDLDEEAEIAAEQSMVQAPPATQTQPNSQMHRFPSPQPQPQARQRHESFGGQAQHLGPPTPQGIVHSQPTTLYSPKPSQPPSPLLQSGNLSYESRTTERYRVDSNANSSTTHERSDHAPYCGCETCSVSKYRSSGSGSTTDHKAPRQQQPSLTSIESKGQRSEKSSKLGTGWIRRLSMPVGNAFGSSDSKKHQSNHSVGGAYALGSGISGGPATSKGGLFSLDSKRNLSTTALGGIQEDGSRLGRPAGGGAGNHQRNSYESSGISNNRSMTNLGLR